MSMQVLKNKDQIDQSRHAMETMGVSAIDSSAVVLMRALRLVRGVAVGDRQKSWDVLHALEFINKEVAKGEAIADIGCFASEVLVSLHKAGYSNLTGIDLNPKLSKMPNADAIRYQVSDFMMTPFEDGSFKAITSISVIEHGYRPEALLKEVARLLQPGGYFIASFDYWPDKIDTTGTTFFGMDWLIFSRGDVEQLVKMAEGHGLLPTGKLEFDGNDKVIHCAGKDYTFALLTLRKSTT